MKPGFQLIGAAVVAAAAGCAGLTPEPPAESDAHFRLDRGLAAIDAARYRDAFEDLTWVYSHCPGREAGTRALAALAALELDPRNPSARPDVGTDLLGRVIQDPGLPRWVRPLAETSFLTALALGAPHPEGAPAAPAPAPADTPVASPTAEDTTAAETDELLGDSVAAPAGEPAVPRAAPPVPEQDTEPAYGCGAAVEAEDWVAPPLPRLPGPSIATMLAEIQLERDSLAVRADTLQQELATARQQLAATQEELERIRRTLRP